MRTRRRPRFAPLRLGSESLERRAMLAATADADDAAITRLSWQGREVEAVRDEWLVRMPTPANPFSIDFYGYQARAPQVPATWTVTSLNYGFYALTAPGASLQDVSTWGRTTGALRVEPNAVLRSTAVPNDPAYGDSAMWGLDKISAPAAWDITTGSPNIVVGVIDSGVDVNHPDLAANMWRNPGEIAGNNLDDDGNGYVDDVHGWSFADSLAGDADLTDTDGHGTHVAGTMSAVGNNDTGVVGVSWNTSIMALKIFDGAGSPVTAATAAINYVTAMRLRGIPIVATTNSYGGDVFNESLFEDAIRLNSDAGVLFVTAAGNDGFDNDVIPDFPSTFDVPNIVSVAASDQADRLTSFSSYGETSVDIAAPGEMIWSTYPTALPDDPGLPDWMPGYAAMDGTSMAAPHVTGVAALVAAAFLEDYGRLPTVAEMKNAILDGADKPATLTYTESAANGDPFPGTVHRIAGNRRLNALGAIQKILDYPEITIGDATIVEGYAGTAYAEVVVSLSAASTRNVTVDFTTADGSARTGNADYVATSGTLTFLPGETEQTIRVAVNGDTAIEPDESFFVQLSNAVSGILPDGLFGTVTIGNDDVPPAVFVDDIEVIEGTGGVTTATFTLELSGPQPFGVTVRYATLDRSATTRDRDYRAVTGTAFIPAGATAATVPVTIVADAKYEGDEKFAFRIVSATGVPITRSIALCTILNDDPVPVPVVSVGDVTLAEGQSTQKMFAFVVSLSMPSPVAVSVGFRTVDGTAVAGLDYVGRTGTLTFAPGVTKRSISVWVTGDTTLEATERFTLELLAPSGATIGRGTGIGTIVNDDKAAPTRRTSATTAMFAALAAEEALAKPLARRR